MSDQLIRVEVEAVVRVSKSIQQLNELPERLKNLRPVMVGAVAPLANQMLLRHWESKGAAFGHTWAPLAPSTIATRARKGTLAKGILRDTDHLFRAIFRERAADSRLSSAPGGYRLRLDTRIPYAIYHQVGTSNMPDRQVIPDPLPRSFVQDVKKVVREYLLTGVVPSA